MSVEERGPKPSRALKLGKERSRWFGANESLHSSAEKAEMRKHIFNDPQLALRAIKAVRWPSGVICIYCGCKAVISHGRDRLHYRCARCAMRFDFSTGTVLADTDLLPHVLLRALYTLSTSNYRYSAFLSLQCHQGLPTRSIEKLWATVRSRCRSYTGSKKPFGRLLQVEMPETPRRVSGQRKEKLIAEGKHQSQKTIHSTGCWRMTQTLREDHFLVR